MCNYSGFDLVFKHGHLVLQRHACRVIDCEGGYLLERATQLMAEHHEALAAMWRDQSHPEIFRLIPDHNPQDTHGRP